MNLKNMNNQTIADIYAANDKIREQFRGAIENLSDEKANFVPDGEKWSVTHLAEHIALVEEGMSKISAKLLTKAQAAGVQGDGTAKLTENFATKAAASRNVKLEAPAQVVPTGNRTIVESLAKMEENRQRLEELRPLFESVECSDFTFPHPFMGELSAHEWLTLIGGHGARHLRQLENLMSKVQ